MYTKNSTFNFKHIHKYTREKCSTSQFCLLDSQIIDNYEFASRKCLHSRFLLCWFCHLLIRDNIMSGMHVFTYQLSAALWVLFVCLESKAFDSWVLFVYSESKAVDSWVLFVCSESKAVNSWVLFVCSESKAVYSWMLFFSFLLYRYFFFPVVKLKGFLLWHCLFETK